LKKLLFVCLASLLVAACGKDRNNDPIANANEASKDRDLQGKNFASSCSIKPLDAVLTGILTGGNAVIKGAKTVYRFDGANVSRTTRLYTTADCSGETAVSFEERGEIDIKKDQKTNDGGKFIDIQYKTLKVSAANDAGATAANSIKLCGASDWAAKQVRDETANSKDMTCYGAQVPRQNANVYRVDANILYLGTQTKASTDASQRPSTLNMADKYTAE
jgi:hypothetical protein